MRKVARYSARANVEGEDRIDDIWNQIQSERQDWLEHKGDIEGDGNGEALKLHMDGQRDRVADLELETRRTDIGELHLLKLREPLEQARFFQTTIECARSEGKLALDASLELGYEEPRVSPPSFEAHCPNLIQSIFDLDVNWFVGESEVLTNARELHSEQDGQNLANQIQNTERTLPLVVVSELQQMTIHPELVQGLAHDLCGLAQVFRISNEVSWVLTNKFGRKWSCYNGAVRIYWPMDNGLDDPYRHELWTRDRMMRGASNTDEAQKRIKQQLRRTVLGLSTITIPRSNLIDKLHKRYRKEQREARLEQVREDSDWKEVAEDYFERALKADELKNENEKLQDKVEQLEKVIEHLQKEKSPEEADENTPIKPEDKVPPATIKEAVEKAEEKFGDVLAIGGDVEEGIGTLPNGTCDPETIFRHLEELANYGYNKKDSEDFSADPCQWVDLNASGESPTIRNNDYKMSKRTWDDGDSMRGFENHTKPKNATDVAVRIYFDWDEERMEMIVGWVGCKPQEI